ncbi:uncharacterized protein [Apostichopus japonicus]|uniref:uncharacterized protein isoform X2 n=1 Tax=Stichopus japonicus TaxID=307972 RepID=UPI003AB65CCA
MSTTKSTQALNTTAAVLQLELEEGMASSDTPNGDKSHIIQDEDNKMDDKTGKLITVCVIIANVIAAVALILAFIGVVKNGNQYYLNADGTSSSSDARTYPGVSSEDKIWVFQIGHFGSNTQYLDEDSGTIRGYDVDVTNAVCQIANKNCRLVWDLYERCWDSQVGQRPRGGMGLMGSSWYDACIGWYHTRDRARTFAFSTPIEKALQPVFYAKAGTSSPLNWPNFAGQTVGFLDGWWIDERCLSRYNPTGFDPLSNSQVIHYQTEEEAVAALNSGEIDVGFLPKVAFLDEHPDIELVFTPPSDQCANGGPGLMTPKDQFELLTWWNAAFDNLISTSEYRSICDNIREDHGDQPGADPEDVCVA